MRKTCLMRGLKILALGGLAAAAARLTGCAEMDNYMAAANTVGRSQGSIYNNQTEPYNGPKARVAVMAFENKTGTGVRIGDGMKEQLVTALAQTGAFILLERNQLNDVLREQNLGASGRANADTAAPIGGVEGADFLIYGAVTEYEANQAGANVGGEGQRANQAGDLFGAAVNAAMSQDHVAIDLRVVDAKTSRIVGATTIQGRARDLSGAINGQFSGILANASGHYNTPIEKAIRACMIKASNWVADNTLRGGVQHVNEEQRPGPYTPHDNRRDDRRDDRRRDGDRRRADRDDDSRDSQRRDEGARPARRAMTQVPAAEAAEAEPMAPPAEAPAPRRAAPAPGRVAPAPVGVGPAPAAGAAAQMTVAAPSAPVYMAPNPSGRMIAKLPQGMAVSVLRQQGDWVQVRMRNGAAGWVQASALQE